MLFVLLVFLLLALIFVDNFATAYNLKNYLKNCAPLLIASTGLTYVVLNGGIDFSITSIISLGSVLGAFVMSSSQLAGTVFAIPVAVLLIIAIGLIFGIANGLAVSRLKMPSFVATLSTQLIGSGLAVLAGNVLFKGAVSLNTPKVFQNLGGKGNMWFVPIVISLILFLAFSWLLRKTVFGKQIYAIGVNPKVAEVSGVPVRKNIFYLFIISGGLAGVASVLYTAKNGAGVPTLGDNMFIDIVGGVVIGGTDPAGGFGSVRNTLYGVLFLTLVSNVLNLLGVEWYFVDLIKGILVVAAAILNLMLKNVGVKNHAQSNS